ncbi:hypothetical protein [Spirosoma aerophilum]
MRLFTFLTIVGLLSTRVGQAQSFQYKAAIDHAQQSGFYRILLPPAVLGRLNPSLTDIRLYDDHQQEIPYKLIRETPGRSVSFADYEIVTRVSKPNVSTTLVIRNRVKAPIRSLTILSKNTNAARKAKLSGSADAQNWYAIDDDIWLKPSQDNLKTTDSQTINFPLSDYEYYRLDINDSLNTPLNILRVGYFTSKASVGRYTSISNLSISQRDSNDRNTYIRLTQPDDARLDRLTIFINAPTPYRRRATISQLRTRKRKRGRIDTWFEPIRSLELSSPDSTIVDLPGLKANDLYLIITNDDNKPLPISRVRGYQLTTYLLANLTAHTNYQLRFSAENSMAPSYDQTAFNAALSANSPILQVGVVNSVRTTDEAPSSVFADSRIIWLALGLVLVVLGAMSYRMIKEMGKAKV